VSAELFDSHCHLEDERFVGEVDEVLARMRAAGVARCLLAGSDKVDSERIAMLAAAYPYVYGVIGVHPHEAKSFDENTLAWMAGLLARPHIVGVGEIGLDYYYDFSPREVQREAFVRQLDFAFEQKSPPFSTCGTPTARCWISSAAAASGCPRACCTATPAAPKARGNTWTWAFTSLFPAL
jgi:TatD DNase family protein